MKWSHILPPEALEIGDSLFALAAQKRTEGYTIYPPQNQIFNALNLTPLKHSRSASSDRTRIMDTARPTD